MGGEFRTSVCVVPFQSSPVDPAMLSCHFKCMHLPVAPCPLPLCPLLSPLRKKCSPLVRRLRHNSTILTPPPPLSLGISLAGRVLCRMRVDTGGGSGQLDEGKQLLVKNWILRRRWLSRMMMPLLTALTGDMCQTTAAQDFGF